MIVLRVGDQESRTQLTDRFRQTIGELDLPEGEHQLWISLSRDTGETQWVMMNELQRVVIERVTTVSQ